MFKEIVQGFTKYWFNTGFTAGNNLKHLAAFLQSAKDP